MKQVLSIEWIANAEQTLVADTRPWPATARQRLSPNHSSKTCTACTACTHSRDRLAFSSALVKHIYTAASPDSPDADVAPVPVPVPVPVPCCSPSFKTRPAAA
jgi:hypothetical protein